MKFNEGKIIERFCVKKDGKNIEIVLRLPRKKDLKNIWKFYNKVRKETPFLDIIKSVKMKEERKWLLNIIQMVKKKNCIYILAECNNKIIGACTVRRQKEDTYLHVGVYDLVVEKEFWGMNIGSALTRNIIKIAKEELKLEILRLILYSGNRPANELYKKFRFHTAGRIPQGVKREGNYMDEIIMYKVLK
ncbi:MAG: GNAT family protein [Candidatus Aenigmatarchaeota archaeon]